MTYSLSVSLSTEMQVKNSEPGWMLLTLQSVGDVAGEGLLTEAQEVKGDWSKLS